MASASILHVGNDVCQRIPVLTRAGFAVRRSEDSIQAIRAALTGEDPFSAILFHCDMAPPAETTVHEARSLSDAPLVLFQNPTVLCNDRDFDLVVPVLIPPGIWLKKLKELIEESHRLCEQAHRLHKDCDSVRSQSRSLRASAARNRKVSIDPNAPWQGKSGPPREPK